MIKPLVSINNSNNVAYFSSRNQYPSNPTMNQAVKVARMVEKTGYIKTEEEYYDFINSEINELRAAVAKKDYENIKEEVGDIIYNSILIADHYNINPSEALNNTNKKLINRVAVATKIAGRPLIELPLRDRLKFWEEAKAAIHNSQEL